jgi:predicted PurR-regulated permease PerM
LADAPAPETAAARSAVAGPAQVAAGPGQAAGAAAAPAGEAGAVSAPAAVPSTMSRFPRLTTPSAAAVVAAIGTVVAIALLIEVGGAVTVFVIGLILAFLLDPIVTWMAARRVPRGVATLLTMVVFFAVVIVLIVSFVGIIASQAAAFVSSLPQALANVEAWIRTLGLAPDVEEDLLNFVNGIAQSIASFDVTALFEPLLNATVAVLGSFFTLITLPFFMFYVLAGRPGLSKSVYASLPAPWNADANTVIRISLDSFGTYVRAEAIVAGLLGLMAFAGNLALGVLVDPAFTEVALLLGIIAAISELIPNYGPWIASIPAVLFALTVGPTAVIATILLYLVIMFVEGQVLVPKIEGGAFSFHPALVLFLVVAGVQLFGLLGAILALPVTAAAWRTTRYAFRRAAGQPPGMQTAIGSEHDDAIVKPYDPETGVPISGAGQDPTPAPPPEAFAG